MDGVTILSENTYRMCSTEFAVVSIIVASILVSFMIFIATKTGDKFDFFLASVIGIAAWAFSICNTISGYNTIQTEYQVMVDSSVSFADFTNRYKVISADGYVYTVIEREQGDNVQVED